LATILEDEAMQRKLDSQSEVLIAFKGMGGMGETEELDDHVKCQSAEEAWKKASTRQGLWKQHKKALEAQLKNIRSSFRRPALHPTPQPFLYCDYKSDNEQSNTMYIGFYRFCLRKFEPIWDCNLVPCLHCYHS
jgi:hypothetical protein